jgi:hypothetical protein
MASPKRWPWKNQREVKRQYNYTYFTHVMTGAVLTMPLAVWVGNRMKVYQGGVPIVPYRRFVNDFYNLDPGYVAKKNFRWYFAVTCIVGGFLFASFTLSKNQMNDPWYSRPDLRPFPAMVPKESMELNEREAYEAHY